METATPAGHNQNFTIFPFVLNCLFLLYICCISIIQLLLANTFMDMDMGIAWNCLANE
jgi:hypothetical protein